MAKAPVSLAYTPSEKVDRATSLNETRPEDMNDYPYGLTIFLSHETLQKLGYASGGLESGARVSLLGSALIVSTESEMINGVKERKCNLQIQTLALEPLEERPAPSSILFGEK